MSGMLMQTEILALNFGIGPKNYQRESMKVVATGTYSQAGLAALADATYEQRRAAMDELYSACGGKIIDYFFCDGDADFVIVAEIPSRLNPLLNNSVFLLWGSNRIGPHCHSTHRLFGFSQSLP